MLEAWFAVPGDLGTPTGGYAYARAVLKRIADHGVRLNHLALPVSYPFPDADDIAETERLLKNVPHRAPLLIDGLAYGAFPEHLAVALPQPIIALVHHPLALESGLDPAVADRLVNSERAALQHADAVITTSRTTAETLIADFDVPRAKVVVAEPGTPRAGRASGSGSATVHLLAVGTISPRKGYSVLVDALARIETHSWKLTIIGDLTRVPQATEDLRRRIEANGLADRISLAGALAAADVLAAYDRADVFVHPALYEGYGMVLAEALAHGLPIVASTGGAAAHTVPDGAALKVAPADTAALASALERIVSRPDLRAELSEAAWKAARFLPTWDDTAATVARALMEVARPA